MDLDFSGLTNDQLIELVRACCHEAMRRDPATGAAMRGMMLDEQEKMRIIRNAAESEAAAIRARERERLATETAERVRAENAAKTAATRQRDAEAAGLRAAEKAHSEERTAIQWLSRFAALVDRRPSDICIVIASTKYGRRVLVNPGRDRYSCDHLVDYNMSTREIRTVRALIKRKPDLAALCAQIAAMHPSGSLAIIGADYDWSHT
jgi:hypothetical protein